MPDIFDLVFPYAPKYDGEIAQVIVGAGGGAAGGGGTPGSVDPSGAFLVANRFSEIAASPAAQTAAQTNLGLGSTDPLAYYILAKA